MANPVRLEHLTSPAVGQLQEQGERLIILPIGATEQHGPHLPINCDTVIAERICEAASAKTQIPLLPTLRVTVSSGHTSKWPGTISLRHETFIQTLEDVSDWLVATGWQRLMLVNSHFGNDAAIRVAVEKIRLRYLGKLQIGFQHTFRLSEKIWETFIADAEDLHANCAETDLMLFLTPDLVEMDRVEDDPDRTGECVFSYPVAQTSVNGVTGSPSQGDAGRGEALFEEMVEALVIVLEKARHERAPLDPAYREAI
ncbi:MAG: creatininase family protein [Verrucomicrobiota bacterium]